MKTNTIETVVSMLEQIPEESQEKIERKIRKMVNEINDEKKWQTQYNNKKENLLNMARLVKEDIKKIL